ncbi:Putative hemolysin (Hlx) [Commensalibacter communis]|uniref:Hemolysin (Hlx) n=1 Tax=Commensalibacter communis TaxID=2972786 RepID=A0A9W4XD22_9PROT|nr:DUF333 domain-containing protein [Commensalibacter communis]CAI3936804.1 Putative hemolysin (Hlx) [Commensalibacter communis]CAI3938725.1 Putative hemolysin (Hlx) [Commensalibacter communis]CAI3941432.1 Putative hemolysin (Hlx) [Commensalibacter communis]CAI3941604.1 Putative hemolysin (Hlx) [Commensalibacter communis]CAI3944769.1 Putative hemolysin (Hlx) [Commensalibacter communis]
MMKLRFWIYLGVGLFMLTACQHPEEKTKDQIIGMPNPASVYCIKLNGKLRSVSTPQGEYAICALPSGEQIEEWALFRRDHVSQ